VFGSRCPPFFLCWYVSNNKNRTNPDKEHRVYRLTRLPRRWVGSGLTLTPRANPCIVTYPSLFYFCRRHILDEFTRRQDVFHSVGSLPTPLPRCIWTYHLSPPPPLVLLRIPLFLPLPFFSFYHQTTLRLAYLSTGRISYRGVSAFSYAS